MACDIRICSENAKFGQPEVGLGIIPGFSGTVRLARLVGMGIAKQLIYTGKPIKADEALRIGLVNAVVPQAELMDKALELANQIAANAPLAVRAAKQCINAEYDMPVDDAIVNESRAFGNCFATEDQKNGMKAFLNKEKYVFQGK
jgi:enoyl-CoA hydratase